MLQLPHAIVGAARAITPTGAAISVCFCMSDLRVRWWFCRSADGAGRRTSDADVIMVWMCLRSVVEDFASGSKKPNALGRPRSCAPTPWCSCRLSSRGQASVSDLPRLVDPLSVPEGANAGPPRPGGPRERAYRRASRGGTYCGEVPDETFVIDPRDWISPPFIACPFCGAEEFGVLMITRSSYVRRCRACMKDEQFGLPALAKKILYLDQFAISKLMKVLHP